MTTFQKTRRRAYEILEKAQPGDVLSAIVDVFILLLIALNITVLMLDSVSDVSRQFTELFKTIEFISVIIFTVEYVLRLWVSVEADIKGNAFRKRVVYIFSFMALIDLFAILPFYLTFLPVGLLFLRTLRIIRILRVFKIGRYSNSLGTMVRVFRRKKDDLLITFFVIFIILIVISNIMYEIESKVQPDLYTNIFQTMWWGIVTVTGVGYGDMYPITAAGRILGSIIAVMGIVIIAIPIGILGAAYVEDAENKRRGKIKVIRTSDHVIICGCTRVTRHIVAGLQREGAVSKIIVVTQKPNPEIPGIIYVNADWTDLTVLKHLSIHESIACILSAENFNTRRETDDYGIIDMRVLFTLYNIKKTYPQVHTISELINAEHLPMIRSNLKGDEIILKEIIDGNLIANCIKIPLVSSLIYELIDLEGKVIQETTSRELKLGKECLYRDVVVYGIENDITFLGYIGGKDNESRLSPSRNDRITGDDRLIFITDR